MMTMRFVITLTDAEFETLSDRTKHLTETLVMRRPENDIEVIIQREGIGEACTCHERDGSYVCDYCYAQGHRGHMQK
jgi:hypothetical protein